MGVYPTHRGTAASFLPSPFGVGDSVISYIKIRFALMSRLSLVDEPADMATSA